MTQSKHRGTKGWAEVTGSSVSLDFKYSHLATKRPSHMLTPAYKGPSHHVHTWLQSGFNNSLPRGRCQSQCTTLHPVWMTSTCILTNEGRVSTGTSGTSLALPYCPCECQSIRGEWETPCVVSNMTDVTFVCLFVCFLAYYLFLGRHPALNY